jgi:hypothetical protein
MQISALEIRQVMGSVYTLHHFSGRPDRPNPFVILSEDERGIINTRSKGGCLCNPIRVGMEKKTRSAMGTRSHVFGHPRYTGCPSLFSMLGSNKINYDETSLL